MAAMKVVKLTHQNQKKILSQTERILSSGKVVIVPTDTVYGIIGDASNPEAVKKIFALKQRPQDKAFPIFVKNVNEARKIAYISDKKAEFLEKIWPAPLEISRPKAADATPSVGRISNGARALTVIFQHKEKLPKVLTGGKDTIGIRIPNHSLLLELLSRLDFPLAQTSANIFGKPIAKNIKEIKEYFGRAEAKPDLIIDGGEVAGKSSTVIDYTGKEPMILRTGVITREKLDQVLESVKE